MWKFRLPVVGEWIGVDSIASSDSDSWLESLNFSTSFSSFIGISCVSSGSTLSAESTVSFLTLSVVFVEVSEEKWSIQYYLQKS